MMAHALDISVLEQGAAASSGTGGNGIDAPSDADLAPLVAWLVEFQEASERHFVIDSAYRLWGEYENLGSDNSVLKILQEKFDHRQYRVQEPNCNQGGEVVVPEAFADRSFVWKLVLGVTLTDRPGISVVNASDPEWVRHEQALSDESVSVEHVLEGWLRDFVSRQDAPGPEPGDHQYHQPPAQLSGELAEATNVGKGSNRRTAWEDGRRRYEFDSQHNTVEVYRLSDGTWLHEAQLDGTVSKTTGGKGRRWGKP